MDKLLSTYSLSEILIIFVVVCGALLSTFKFGEEIYLRIKKISTSEVKTQNKEEEVNSRLNDIESKQKTTDDAIGRINSSMDFLADKLEILVESDKDSIKSYLTDKHHYYVYDQKWIDDYNLDCMERRYVHYKKAGGNSFVDNLMAQMRALPNQPPKE